VSSLVDEAPEEVSEDRLELVRVYRLVRGYRCRKGLQSLALRRDGTHRRLGRAARSRGSNVAEGTLTKARPSRHSKKASTRQTTFARIWRARGLTEPCRDNTDIIPGG
jgi:hypothetical protein